MLPRLTLIFRDKRQSNNSIERLFSTLTPYIQKHFDIETITMPAQPSGFRALYRNIRYALQHSSGIRHITGDAQYLATFFSRKRTVLTIHDCGYLMKLTGVKKWLYKWIWFKLPCLRAGRVTVISEATKEVLEREIGTLGNKLSVIDNCVTIDIEPTQRTFNEACPRILQIGSGPHKNLDTLIRAVSGVACELKIVGKISGENLAALERESIRYTNEYAVPDERIKEIYRECDILFFASRHEGFGLPILEANSVGIPVITSSCYSMPHVAGNAGLIVNPESFSEIRDAIQQLISSPELRSDLVRNGFENVKRFTPEAIASKYAEVYQAIVPSSL